MNKKLVTLSKRTHKDRHLEWTLLVHSNLFLIDQFNCFRKYSFQIQGKRLKWFLCYCVIIGPLALPGKDVRASVCLKPVFLGMCLLVSFEIWHNNT